MSSTVLGLPLLSTVIFLPLFGVIFLLFIRGSEPAVSRNARAVTLLTSLATFALSLMVLGDFDKDISGFQLVEKHTWIALLNSSYHVGVDGISVLFVVLSAFLTPLAVLASWTAIKKRVREYMIAFLVLETMMIGMFCALDLVLFYLFFEGVLIPMFLIIGIWGGERRIYASLKFFLYTFLGSVLMLVAMVVMYFQLDGTSIEAAIDHIFPATMQVWLWLAFFVSFAVKVPMWPVHTWLPDAHVEAPTGGSVILAGVMLKMGGYGFLRFSLPMFPEASVYFAPYVLGLSVIAVIYTSLVALVQKDMKKLIAYSSVAHMGIVTCGTFTFMPEGLQGAVFQMISHGLVSGALFLCVGIIYDRVHTREIERYGGLVQRMPYYAVAFLIFTFASIGLPGTSGFVGEILVLMAAFQVNGWLAFGIATGMVLGAAYALWLYRRVVFGPLEKSDLKKLLDLTLREKLVLAPLIITVIGFGIYPQPLLNLSDKAVAKILRPYKNMNPLAQHQAHTVADSRFVQTKEN
jgi:NADH-quinone oxidoreductase subunit M